MVDHGIEPAVDLFRANVSQLEPLLGAEAQQLDEVVGAHNVFLDLVLELHDIRHGAADVMGYYHTMLQPLEAETEAAILRLRRAQNSEISETVERMSALHTLLRRGVPVLLVLALALAYVAYRLRTVWRRQRVKELEKINQAKSEFITTVSHELRTPLTSVLGFAQLLRDADAGLSPSERAEMIDSICQQGAEVAGIVEDLLVAGRNELGELKVASVPVDLRAQIAQVLESWRPYAAVPVEIAGETVLGRGDPLRVRQILRNLLDNARRYGGNLIRIEVGANGPSSVYLSVKDNGVGVPVEDQARMFQPFERSGSNPVPTGSMGIGLAVSRQLAQLMEGELNYRYEGGESIFALSLPVARSNSTLTRQIEDQRLLAP